MLRLDWTLPVNLIGEKVSNPMIHCCDKCLKPILIYGRLIPCKHVYCLGCGRQEEGKPCPRCRERVVRVEQTGLAQLFMCTHGGSRYGHDGCRRTYLSQRDLQAHVSHRHQRITREPQKISTVSSSRGTMGGATGSSSLQQQHIPVLNSRSNLVSVPILDTTRSSSSYSAHSAGPTGFNTYQHYAGQQQPAAQYGYPSSFPPPPPPPLPPSMPYDNNAQSGSFQQWAGAPNQTYYRWKSRRVVNVYFLYWFSLKDTEEEWGIIR